MENSGQKKILIVVAILFLSITTGYGQLDTRTQNQIKAKFLTAQEYYDDGNYTESLEKVSEIEELTGGQVLAAAQNLKVKCLIDQDKINQAKEELYVLEGLNLSSEIIRDVAEHNQKIEKFYEREKEQEARKLRAQEEEIARENEAKRIDKENWDEAQSEHTIESYEAYLNNDDNSLYRMEAKTVLAEDETFIRIREEKENRATANGLTEFYLQNRSYSTPTVFEISKSPDVLRLEEFINYREGPVYEVHKIYLEKLINISLFGSRNGGGTTYLKFESEVDRILYNKKRTKITYQQRLSPTSEYYLPIISFESEEDAIIFCEALKTYLNSLGYSPKFTRRE